VPDDLAAVQMHLSSQEPPEPVSDLGRRAQGVVLRPRHHGAEQPAPQACRIEPVRRTGDAVDGLTAVGDQPGRRQRREVVAAEATDDLGIDLSLQEQVAVVAETLRQGVATRTVRFRHRLQPAQSVRAFVQHVAVRG